MTAVAFGLVAILCTLARALATGGQPAHQIPWRTFAVNAGGAFLLGLVTTTSWIDNPLIIAIAGLGSLTTFSTIAAETATRLDNGRKPDAIAYVVLSVVVGIAAAWLGLIIGDSS